MKIITLPKWMWYKNFEGLTLYKLVFIKEGLSPYRRGYVIGHEACHYLQWKREGFFKFPYNYIKELLAVGYRKNKYELEAVYFGELNRDKYSGYTKEEIDKFKAACCWGE